MFTAWKFDSDWIPNQVTLSGQSAEELKHVGRKINKQRGTGEISISISLQLQKTVKLLHILWSPCIYYIATSLRRLQPWLEIAVISSLGSLRSQKSETVCRGFHIQDREKFKNFFEWELNFHLHQPIGVPTGLHKLSVGIKLTGWAPCVCEDEEWPDVIRAWGV